MTNLNELIRSFCPNGVPEKTLGELGTFERGRRFVKSDVVDSNGTPCIHYGEMYTHYGIWATETKSMINPNLKTKLRFASKNDVIIVAAGENKDDIGVGLAWLGDYNVAIHDACYIFSHSQNPKYISYYLRTQSYHDQIRKYVAEGKICSLSSDYISKAIIKIPPLEIQNEIVRILDTFTALTAELTAELNAELTARKRQYEFYRDKLLSFDDRTSEESKSLGVRWMIFGDIATISRGASPRPIQSYITHNEDGVNWIKIGDVSPGQKYITSTEEKITKEGAFKSRYVHPGDFILSNSMSFGRPYILSIDGCIHDGWLSISNYENFVTADYLYHVLNSSSIQNEMSRKASSGTVKNLNAEIVKSLIIPVPCLDYQKQVVNILDRFDNLCLNMIQGLSAEIFARQKQYKYYRDKLLSFEEVN